jgi:hypothetical protein
MGKGRESGIESTSGFCSRGAVAESSAFLAKFRQDKQDEKDSERQYLKDFIQQILLILSKITFGCGWPR